jgi:hypothetical protein
MMVPRLHRGRVVGIPRRISNALTVVFGPGVERVRLVEHSLFARLHGALATTRRRCIFLRGSAANFFADPGLMLHEYCHVLLQWETGRLTTLRYVFELIKRGYWANRFEVEARKFARAELARFRSALAAEQMLVRPAPPSRTS